MEILILKVIVSIALLFVIVYLSYRAGYNLREKIFQEKPITFVVGKESALYVERKEGILLVRIYNEKLVKIEK